MKSGAARDRLAQGIVGAAGGLGAYVIIVLTALPVIRAASSPPPPLPFLHNRDSTDKSQTQQAAGGLQTENTLIQPLQIPLKTKSALRPNASGSRRAVLAHAHIFETSYSTLPQGDLP